MTCGLCGKPMKGFGFADGVPLCHPEPPEQDCYRLWTVYGVRPKPSGDGGGR